MVGGTRLGVCLTILHAPRFFLSDGTLSPSLLHCYGDGSDDVDSFKGTCTLGYVVNEDDYEDEDLSFISQQ